MKILYLATALPIAALISAFGSKAPVQGDQSPIEASAPQDGPEPARIEPIAWIRPAWRIVVSSPKVAAGRGCPPFSFFPGSVSVNPDERNIPDNAPDMVNLLKRRFAEQTTTLRALRAAADDDMRVLLGPPTGDGLEGSDLAVVSDFGENHPLPYGISSDPRMEVIYIYDPTTGQCHCQKGDGLTLGGQFVYVALDDGGLVQLMAQIEIAISELPDPPEDDR